MPDRPGPPKLNAVGQLFGAYLHQDWAFEFADADAAVWAMIKGEPATEVAEAATEIRVLLETVSDEVELKRAMTDEAGCFYDPSAGGETWRAWLQKVATRLERPIAT